MRIFFKLAKSIVLIENARIGHTHNQISFLYDPFSYIFSIILNSITF
jgi:hypothetical protein